MERRRLAARASAVQRFVERPAATEDGRRVEVGANIGVGGRSRARRSPAARRASGCSGRRCCSSPATSPRPRTSSSSSIARGRRRPAGGRSSSGRSTSAATSPSRTSALPKEDNPFLGYRAVRIYPEFEALFRAQIRALVRASAFGRLQVMIPMVSRLDEVTLGAGGDRRRAGSASRRAGVAFDRGMPVGAMIEVPSAAFLLEPLARRARLLQHRHERPAAVLPRGRSDQPAARAAREPARTGVPPPARRIVVEAARARALGGPVRRNGRPGALPAAPGRPRARRTQHAAAGHRRRRRRCWPACRPPRAGPCVERAMRRRTARRGRAHCSTQRATGGRCR